MRTRAKANVESGAKLKNTISGRRANASTKDRDEADEIVPHDIYQLSIGLGPGVTQWLNIASLALAPKCFVAQCPWPLIIPGTRLLAGD